MEETQNSNPLVSVIIPIYKVESFLRECVDSVIAQTYPNLEIILVDDGSPDGCPAICDEYAAKDSRVRVLHKENGGLSDARNAGMKIANGKYYSFVDSDDVIHPAMIEALITPILRDDSIKMSACDYREIEEDYSANNIEETCDTDMYENMSFECFAKDFSLWCVAWGKLYEKSLFSDIKYPVGRLHEDEFTTYRLCYKAGTIAATTFKGYLYRKRRTSIMANRSAKNLTDSLDAYKGRLDFAFSVKSDFLYRSAMLSAFNIYFGTFMPPLNKIATSEVRKKYRKFLTDCDKKKLPHLQRVKFYLKFYFPRFFAIIVRMKSCVLSSRRR